MRALWLTLLIACRSPRSYELVVPEGPGTALVVALHGGEGTGATFERNTRFAELAKREHFIVVFPDGIGHHWHDGRPNVGDPSVDDVAFIHSLVDDLAARHAIDRNRIFATGFSNGAIMSYRLACELPDVFAAIAPVAGNIGTNVAPTCHPARPVSVLAINGDADPLVPYGGGPVAKTHGEVLGAVPSTQLFAAADGCGAAAAPVDELDVDAADGTHTQRIDYACTAPIAVELLTIVGGGHAWPGGPIRPTLGATSRDFDASERIWQFFAAHGR